MDKEDKILMGIILSVLLFMCICVYGWINNFVKFVQQDFQSPYKVEIIRGIGVIIVPIGIVEGLFVYFEEDK